MKTIGYSLWLVPEGDPYSKLTRVISDLSMRFRTPIFEPHVTLFPDILGEEPDIISKTARIVHALKPFGVALTSVGTSSEYFRSIFINASSAELVSANTVCRKIFGRESDAPYVPHLSLLYGKIPDEEKKKTLSSLPDLSSAFTVRSIRLNYMNGTPSQWRKVKEFSFR